MKICPNCRRTYADDGLNFCLEDGTMLTAASAPAPPTVRMVAPQATSRPQTYPVSNTGISPQASSMKPKRSSRAWLWAAVILGGVILICGGGMAAMVGYVYTHPELADNKTSNSENKRIATSTNNANTSNTVANTSITDDGFDTLDLSDWVKENSLWGNTEYVNDEFVMSSKQKGYYYVLVAPEGYTTEAATTRVTLRNIDNAASSMGYGLVFHSNPEPLTDDYAFLIDTKKRKYRVVHHLPDKESTILAWTGSNMIKEGSAENVLEARDLSGSAELYLNGQLVTTVKTPNAYKNGVPGLYSGDGARIAFKNLQVKK